MRKLPGAKVSAMSPFYHSAPQGCPGNQPDYCNAVVAVKTSLPPRRLHLRLQKVERAVQRLCGGRKRKRNAPRHLDIDYLFHGAARLRGKHLTLPHPRILERAFVLRPLADIVGEDFQSLRWNSRAKQCAVALAKLTAKTSPIILALESGGETFSAALIKPDGEIIMKSFSNTSPSGSGAGVRGGHSENALPTIAALLKECNLTMKQCDAFAFAAGPGKFSGLRLSCAFCQSFAYAFNRPIVAVPTFAALAESNHPAAECGDGKTLTAALPAHRGHFHIAKCLVKDGIWRAQKPRIVTANKNPAPMPESHPDAAAVLRVSLSMFAKGETTTPEKCQPQYVRQKIALTIKERARIN